MVASVATVLLVLAAGGDAVLLQFSSQNCAPCQAMQSTVERLAGSGYSVRRVDVDNYPQVARQYDVREIPCFVMLHGGRETDRVVGRASFDRLAAMYTPPEQNSQPSTTFVSHPGAAQGPSAAQPAAQYVPAPYKPEPYQPQHLAAGPMAQAPVAQAPAASQPQVPAAYEQADFSAPRAVAVTPTQYREEAANPTDVRRRAMAATVRLKVEDETGFGFGTGTIIDTHDDEALVVTCGHLFRESQGKGTISVDLFAAAGAPSIAGQLIAYDLTRDIALVSIRPGMKVTPMTVASGLAPVVPRESVFSIGCDKGGEPSVRDSQVTGVNKFRGPPNVTVAGQPVDGRSGGGLFSEQGELIGICNAANPADDEGLYAALGSIHWQLDQIGQTQLYKREAEVSQQSPAAMPQEVPPAQSQQFAPNTFAANEAVAPAAAVQPAGNFALPEEQLPTEFPQRQQEAAPAVMSASIPSGRQQFARTVEDAFAGAGADEEMILIVRSRSNPAAPSQVYVLDRPGSKLVSEMAAVARPLAPAANAPPAQQLARENQQPSNDPRSDRFARRDEYSSEPIIRGQSQP